MFGLEDQKKKKKAGEFIFELEEELKIAKKHQEIKRRADNRLQQLREMLRSGGEKEEYNRLGVLLHGYASLLKVISRVTSK
ncbi:MAG: DUF5398 family protein [Parachlamydiaceae bacterium]|nr:DUF5398 family protein [Parachlamydiaceae bacterium]